LGRAKRWGREEGEEEVEGEAVMGKEEGERKGKKAEAAFVHEVASEFSREEGEDPLVEVKRKEMGCCQCLVYGEICQLICVKDP
jgi:hypothetical protein